MSEELTGLQMKHARIEYLLKCLQVLVALKKEFALQQRLEEEILRAIRLESPDPAPAIIEAK